MRKLIVTLILILQLSDPAQSQSTTEIQRSLKEARMEFEYGDYPKAISLFSEILKKDSLSAEAYYYLASCKLALREPDQEIFPLTERASLLEHTESIFLHAIMLHRNAQFEEAIDHFQKYRNILKRERSDEEIARYIQISLRAKDVISKPGTATIHNVGPTINSQYPDYVPVTDPAKKRMYFTSRRPGGISDKKDALGQYFEDIYVSEFKNGEWSPPYNAGLPVNSESHDACAGISTDGSRLFIYRTLPGQLTGDLYVCNDTNGTWSEPEKLPSHINSDHTEASICISSDNSTIYFSSDRPGGYGGKDLYRCVILPDGSWSRPYNLGPTINTRLNEDAPFLHPDNRTLYFSSEAHSTLGGYDIFRTVKKENGLWSEPENIGHPANTPSDDIFFTLSADGKTGYYSSQRHDGSGSQDIYEIRLVKESTQVAVVPGNISNERNEGLRAGITLIEESTNTLVGIFNSGSNGRFILVCSPESRYKIIAEAEGYVPQVIHQSFDELHIPVIIKLKSR